MGIKNSGKKDDENHSEPRKWCHARLWGRASPLKALGSVAYYLANCANILTN